MRNNNNQATQTQRADMDLDFELLMTNIRAQVHEYIDNVLVKCCKEYDLPFNEVRKNLGLVQEDVGTEEMVVEPVPVKQPVKKPPKKSSIERRMCTALTRNGEPCKSRAIDNETYCKKHLTSIQRKEEAGTSQKRKKEPTKTNKAKKPIEVTVNDLPKDEAEWLVKEEPTVGTIAPDLTMTESFFPADVLYEEEDIIDDVSESEYVLDE